MLPVVKVLVVYSQSCYQLPPDEGLLVVYRVEFAIDSLSVGEGICL